MGLKVATWESGIDFHEADLTKVQFAVSTHFASVGKTSCPKLYPVTHSNDMSH